jgi:hypothetical protein
MTTTRRIIFYSWQSDLPGKTNRWFILDALEKAAKAIRNDASLQEMPIVDRDTQDVPGAPDIAQTILGKIEQADVFVCDVSNINREAVSPQSRLRPTPNPNVLLELGYALKALGSGRILLILNTAFGEIEDLPFDLRTKRIIRYAMPEEAERATVRKELGNDIETQVRLIFGAVGPQEAPQPLSLAERTRVAVEAERSEQVALTRQYMVELAENIAGRNPTLREGEEQRWVEQVRQAITESTGVVLEFAHVAETIASKNAIPAAHALYRGFSALLELHKPPPGFSGAYSFARFDFPRFLGHELFVSFFACLIREDRWELIAELFEEDLYVRNSGQVERKPFTMLSDSVWVFKQGPFGLMPAAKSLHPDVLNEQHTKGELGQLVPMDALMEADYFLFLRAQLEPEQAQQGLEWVPWSTRSMRYVPRYLLEASRTKFGQRLVRALGIADIPTMRSRFAERAHQLVGFWGTAFWDYFMAPFDADTIGSR